MKYFKALHANMGEEYLHVAQVSEECFEDVWHEIDFNETGYVTWH